MLSILVGIVLIIGGIGWSLLAFFAAGMASRQIDTWNEQVKPALYGLAPVVLGAALIYWR